MCIRDSPHVQENIWTIKEGYLTNIIYKTILFEYSFQNIQNVKNWTVKISNRVITNLETKQTTITFHPLQNLIKT